MTSFVGRAGELTMLREALPGTRLLTITGAGGVGKTRLAIRAAAEARGAFGDDVCFVDLSRLADVELLAHTLCGALQLPDQPDEDQVEALLGHLAERRALLVLDGCQHLAGGCAMLVGLLLRTAPGLNVLATSRAVLGVAGEREVRLGPLPAGDTAALFAERAAAAAPGFEVDGGNRAAVGELCRRLEGVPLAVELAAGQMRETPPELLLDDLTGLDGTFTAAVEWRHRLCTPDERRLWARLSVFAGDFDVKAAEYVGGPADGDGPRVLQTLSCLVEKSIVVREPGGERYRMPETISRYGVDRLRESGDERAVRRLHRDWYSRLTDRFAAQMVSESQYHWADRLRAEHANLRRAIDHSYRTPGQEDHGLRMAAEIWVYWITNGMSGEGRHWIARGLAATRPEPSRIRAEAHWALAQLTMVRGTDLDAARHHLADLRDLAEMLDADEVRAWAANLGGQIALFEGDAVTAAGSLTTAVAILRNHPAGGVLLQSYPVLASAHLSLGEVDTAIDVCEEGRALGIRLGERWISAYCVFLRGLARWLRGDVAAATAASRECLRLQQGAHDKVGWAFMVDSLAWYAMSDGDATRAVRLLGTAGTVWDAVSRPHLGVRGFLVLRERCEAQARAALGERSFETAYAEGAARSIHQVIAEETTTLRP
ncbi:AAA family ATPase [Spirillospora sp. NPDC047279]|uniref:ATP-binding protein n=1 Tax=Spirillospora sp. NPDC047279 TaxID=3155478 RepID=UPI0033EE55A9